MLQVGVKGYKTRVQTATDSLVIKGLCEGCVLTDVLYTNEEHDSKTDGISRPPQPLPKAVMMQQNSSNIEIQAWNLFVKSDKNVLQAIA